MFIPYAVDVPFDHRPVLNWLISAALVLAFVMQIAAVLGQVDQGLSLQDAAQKTMGQFVLDGWGVSGLFGHMWLHAGILHLVGNLIFLWLFGNAVCSKIGNLLYLPVYAGLGLIAGISHLIFSGGPVVGASGAINGIVGMYLVFFPENSISCFFWLFYRPITFSVSGCWMILLWFAFDIWGAMSGGQGVAFVAHIGGFIAGFALAVLMLKMGWVAMQRDEKSLLQMLSMTKRTASGGSGGSPAPSLQRREQARSEVVERLPVPKEPARPKDTYIRFSCRCGQRMKAPRAQAGQIGRCPKCKTPIKIPGTADGGSSD
ncbi:MAG: rhomboid family intramembrane serine protease [Planctomycetota bacterium]|jgi:membrane associated rhomboid family serine protease